ncbi:integrin alpha-L isoform X2, partial [Silurus asotus]
VPFQINCKNRSCVSDLQLDFSFQNKTLLVVDQASFIIHVTLQNKGDDSFNTSVVLLYPPGLSLSVFKTIKVQHSFTHTLLISLFIRLSAVSDSGSDCDSESD